MGFASWHHSITASSFASDLELEEMSRDESDHGASRPLLDHERSRDSNAAGELTGAGAGAGDTAADHGEDEHPTRFVWILTIVTGVSGLLFGYE